MSVIRLFYWRVQRWQTLWLWKPQLGIVMLRAHFHQRWSDIFLFDQTSQLKLRCSKQLNKTYEGLNDATTWLTSCLWLDLCEAVNMTWTQTCDLVPPLTPLTCTQSCSRPIPSCPAPLLPPPQVVLRSWPPDPSPLSALTEAAGKLSPKAGGRR